MRPNKELTFGDYKSTSASSFLGHDGDRNPTPRALNKHQHHQVKEGDFSLLPLLFAFVLVPVDLGRLWSFLGNIFKCADEFISLSHAPIPATSVFLLQEWYTNGDNGTKFSS
ncbi:Uncharacterized protein Fot_04394 [Forsythia ovata]|uniref:Uncharacterized protein n=1 Tax=Forsythia ovata TaxID=205694 RepID=A0ABD1XGH6_9LAMI